MAEALLTVLMAFGPTVRRTRRQQFKRLTTEVGAG
jgi:hypothetical protein